MRIKILTTRDFTPATERSITLALVVDREMTVKRDWGEELVAAGDAVELDPPARDPLDHDGDGKKGGDAAAAKAAKAETKAAQTGGDES